MNRWIPGFIVKKFLSRQVIGLTLRVNRLQLKD